MRSKLFINIFILNMFFLSAFSQSQSVHRSADKRKSWNDLHALIPIMIVEGLMGYAYSCPDLTGGGEFNSFLNSEKVDQHFSDTVN